MRCADVFSSLRDIDGLPFIIAEVYACRRHFGNITDDGIRLYISLLAPFSFIAYFKDAFSTEIIAFAAARSTRDAAIACRVLIGDIG